MMKKLLMCLMLVGFGLALTTSQALAINNSVLIGLDFQAQFQNWDASQVYSLPFSGVGDGLGDSFVLVSVTNINKLSDSSLLWSQTPTDALTGIMYGLDDTSATIFGPIEVITSKGGFVDLYSKPFTLNPILNPAPTIPYAVTPADAWGATGTPAELYLSLQFVPGVIALDPLNTFESVLSSFTPTSVIGSSSGYLKVIGGSAASLYDSNAYNSIFPGADMFLYDGFSTGTLTPAQIAAGWSVGSSGNVTGRGNAIPEPASMILVGIGLAGAARLRRRTA